MSRLSTLYAVVAHEAGNNIRLLLSDGNSPQSWIPLNNIIQYLGNKTIINRSKETAVMHLHGLKNAHDGNNGTSNFGESLHCLFQGKSNAKFALSLGEITFTVDHAWISFTSQGENGVTEHIHLMSRYPE